MLNKFFPENLAVNEKLWKQYSTAGQANDIACWVTKSTNTHSEYVKRIAFPRQHC